jgi:hypothetical protein
VYRLTSVLALSAAFCLTALPVHAAPPSPANPAGVALGIVPTHNGAVRGSGAGQLTYHSGGAVQTGTHNTYAIYWNPNGAGTYSSGYQNTINGYFSDVAAASAARATDNVYDSDTQYYQTIGGKTTYITYSENFAGSAADTAAPVGTGCTNTSGGSLGCITDQQIADEVEAVRSKNGWPTGANAEYFVFLARGFSTCAGSQCFVSYFCAYHSSYTNSSSQTVIYANMPYANYSSTACGTGQNPYGDADAQATLNVTSHEANESITDYLGNAWYDKAGYENGDKCAWKFGTPLGGSNGTYYNQVINGHPYYLQGEYSNQDRGCIWSGV